MKVMIWGGMILFSTIGGYIPILLGSSWFSFWPLIGNGIGGILGVMIGYKLGNYWELE